MFLFEAFYRKLINRGMSSCAKLIVEGKADIPAGMRRPRNMYLHLGSTPCHSQDFQFKQFKTWIVFLVQTAKKEKGWLVARLSENLPRSPLKLHMKQSLGIQECFRCFDPPQTRNLGSAKHCNLEPMKEKCEAST